MIKSEEFNSKMQRDHRTWKHLLYESRKVDYQIREKFSKALWDLTSLAKPIEDSFASPKVDNINDNSDVANEP